MNFGWGIGDCETQDVRRGRIEAQCVLIVITEMLSQRDLGSLGVVSVLQTLVGFQNARFSFGDLSQKVAIPLFLIFAIAIQSPLGDS